MIRPHGAGNDLIYGNFGSDDLAGSDGRDFIDGDNPNEGEFRGPTDPSPHADRCSGGADFNVIENCEVVL